MKILILVDVLNNWALHNRAKAIKKYLPEYQVDIAPALHENDWAKRLDDYDLVHFNFSYGLTDFAPIVKNILHKSVITVVNERSLFAGHGVDADVFDKLLSSCPFVTSVSKKIADLYTGMRYIPNGIDEDIFRKRKTPVVGYAGVSDTPNKNVSAVIEACESLGLELLVATYNRREGDNKQYPHERMQDFYCSLDVYVHASLTEGFNNTVIEALACNVPVLMTKQGCWQEFEGWVEFIEPTAEDIKEKLKKFIGRKLIDEKFLWKNIIPQYKEVYDAAFARARKVQRTARSVSR